MANSRPGMKRKESPQAPKAEIDSQVMMNYQYSSVSCVCHDGPVLKGPFWHYE